MDQSLVDRRVGRILQLFHTFEEQRKCFGVLIRNTPTFMLLANRQYVEWMLRNRKRIHQLGAAAAEELAEKAEADAEFERKILGG